MRHKDERESLVPDSGPGTARNSPTPADVIIRGSHVRSSVAAECHQPRRKRSVLMLCQKNSASRVEAPPPPPPAAPGPPGRVHPGVCWLTPNRPSPTIRLCSSCSNAHVSAALLRLTGVNTDAVNQPPPEPESADQSDAAPVVLPRSSGSCDLMDGGRVRPPAAAVGGSADCSESAAVNQAVVKRRR